jgi:hypothetical protein
MLQRLNIVIVVAALVLLVTTSTRAQVDTSNPKAAVKSLYGAVAKGDASALRSILLVDGDPQQQFVAGYAELIIAGKRLADAAKAKYPGVATAFTQGTILPEDAAKIDSAKVSIEGETATVKVNDRDEPLKLRKVDGAWRVVVGTQEPGSAPAQRESQLTLLRGLTEAMNASAQDITADKFGSAQEAETAVKDRLGAVLTKALQNEGPTSKPTTRP